LKNNISDKDKRDWEDFISKNDELPDKDIEILKKKNLKSRSIDLHGYTLENANKIITEFITNSFLENINKLVIITGKGLHSDNQKNPYVSKDLSILKYSVRDFISNSKNIMKMINSIEDAKVEDGGEGAFYIYLKKNKKL
tara:strand:- start:1278 stop:1697 length:420 start_codon:yes stop_codon:yes gene_type:complete